MERTIQTPFVESAKKKKKRFEKKTPIFVGASYLNFWRDDLYLFFANSKIRPQKLS